jgi:hypothetical protein
LGRTELGGTYLSSVNRRKCFNNFLDAFGTENVHVICDNCNDDTIKFIRSKGIKDVDITSLGNTRSFMYCIDRATSELDASDISYFAEDDYLYTSDAREYIIEGANLGEYTTCFDSLDKYKDTDKGGYNPLISRGGEITRVVLGKKCFYKETNATTGTFAAKIQILREDYPIISKHNQPEFDHPHDFAMFRELIVTRGRRIMVPLPGHSFHVGLEPSPFVDWETIVNNLKED